MFNLAKNNVESNLHICGNCNTNWGCGVNSILDIKLSEKE